MSVVHKIELESISNMTEIRAEDNVKRGTANEERKGRERG